MQGYGAVDDRTDKILVDWSDRLQKEVRELAHVLEADRAYEEEPTGPEDAIRS
jgi:hypothetical protein